VPCIAVYDWQCTLREQGFPHRPALRSLARDLLGLTIQQGAHDSRIDAGVSLRLARLKLEKGPAFGVIGRNQQHLLSVLCQAGVAVAMVDRREVLNQHAPLPGSNLSLSESDADAVVVHQLRPLLEEEPAKGRRRLIVCSLNDYWEALEDRAVALNAGAVLNELVGKEEADDKGEELVDRLVQRVRELRGWLPPGGVMVVVSGSGDTPRCRALLGDSAERKEESFEARNARRAVASEHARFKALAERARRGVVLVG
jgi:hypothetical protein